MANDQGSGATVMVAFLLGALTGAAAALLFAPAAGRETRELLAERAREGRDKAAEAARQTRDLLTRQRDNLATAIDQGRQAYRDAREKEPM
jgi:gas vesicle protein